MNEHIVTEHNRVVEKRDLTYILGDITMETAEYYFYLDQMNGRKRVILGNHDSRLDVPELLNYVETVSGMEKYKSIFLSHCPVHPQELQYRVSRNIHGHVHEYSVTKEIIEGKRQTDAGTLDPRYINVSCENVDYRPRTLEELIPGYTESYKKYRNERKKG